MKNSLKIYFAFGVVVIFCGGYCFFTSMIFPLYKAYKFEQQTMASNPFYEVEFLRSNHRFYDIDGYYGSNEININIRKLHEIPFFKLDDSAIRHRNTEHGTPRCLALELNVKKSIDENRLCKLDSDCVEVPSVPFNDAINKNNIALIKGPLIEYYTYCVTGIVAQTIYRIAKCKEASCKLKSPKED